MLIKDEEIRKGVLTVCDLYGCANTPKQANAYIVKHKNSSPGDFRNPTEYSVSTVTLAGKYKYRYTKQDYSFEGGFHWFTYDVLREGNVLQDYFSSGGMYLSLQRPGLAGNLFYENSFSLPAELYNDLSNGLLHRIAAADYGVGTFLAELPSTVNSLARAAETLVNVILAVKGGRYNAAVEKLGLRRSKHWLTKREERVIRRFGLSDLPKSTANKLLPDEVAKRYLEVQFGLMPLISDVDDIVRMMVGLDRSIFTNSEDIKLSQTYNGSRDNLPFGSEYSGKASHEYSIRGSMKVTFVVDDAERIAEKALGAHSWYAAIYNAVPWSWLLDYVVNIGELLELSTATDGVKFRTGYYSYKTEGNITEEVNSNWISDGPLGLKADYKRRVYTFRSYRRHLMYSFPLPHLKLNFDGINLSKIANVAAVAISLRSL